MKAEREQQPGAEKKYGPPGDDAPVDAHGPFIVMSELAAQRPSSAAKDFIRVRAQRAPSIAPLAAATHVGLLARRLSLRRRNEMGADPF